MGFFPIPSNPVNSIAYSDINDLVLHNIYELLILQEDEVSYVQDISK